MVLKNRNKRDVDAMAIDRYCNNGGFTIGYF
jgi:hypothetical protein